MFKNGQRLVLQTRKVFRLSRKIFGGFSACRKLFGSAAYVGGLGLYVRWMCHLNSMMLIWDRLVMVIWRNECRSRSSESENWEMIRFSWLFRCLASVLKFPSLFWHCWLSASVLWRCWLGGRKVIRPVKNWVVGCWRGYVSGSRCRFAYGPADATATHSCFSKSRLVLPSWLHATGHAIVRKCHGNSVCLSVCLSVCHTGGSVKSVWS